MRFKVIFKDILKYLKKNWKIDFLLLLTRKKNFNNIKNLKF